MSWTEDAAGGSIRRTISGADSIDATSIYKNGGGAAGHYNNGGVAYTYIANDATGTYNWRTIIRLLSNQIPYGTITGFSMVCTFTWLDGYTPRDIRLDRISAANTWVVGSAAGDVAETGACDWFDAKHGSQTWAGSEGCGTQDTDFFNDNVCPATITGGSTTITLPVAWAPYFRDSSSDNNGILLRCNTESNFVIAIVPKSGIQFLVDYIPNLPIQSILTRR